MNHGFERMLKVAASISSTSLSHVGFTVPTAAAMKSELFWFVMSSISEYELHSATAQNTVVFTIL
jgi:hypothetical protein